MKTEIECVKVFNIAKNKVYWQYRCGDTIIDANQSDPETERAIVAMFKQKLGADTEFEVVPHKLFKVGSQITVRNPAN